MKNRFYYFKKVYSSFDGIPELTFPAKSDAESYLEVWARDIFSNAKFLENSADVVTWLENSHYNYKISAIVHQSLNNKPQLYISFRDKVYICDYILTDVIHTLLKEYKLRYGYMETKQNS